MKSIQIVQGGISMDNKELVLKTLNESKEPLKAKDIAEKINIDKKDVDKAIKQLKKRRFNPITKKMFLCSKINHTS